MIEVKKYEPTIVTKKKNNMIINLVASFILLVSLFLLTAQPTYAAQNKNTCSSGSATCTCDGPCWAGDGMCGCL